jgi:hypothetical protein
MRRRSLDRHHARAAKQRSMYRARGPRGALSRGRPCPWRVSRRAVELRSVAARPWSEIERGACAALVRPPSAPTLPVGPRVPGVEHPPPHRLIDRRRDTEGLSGHQTSSYSRPRLGSGTNVRNRFLADAVEDREREAGRADDAGNASFAADDVRKLLLASGADVPYAMAQLDHEEPKLTLVWCRSPASTSSVMRLAAQVAWSSGTSCSAGRWSRCPSSGSIDWRLMQQPRSLHHAMGRDPTRPAKHGGHPRLSPCCCPSK